MYTHGKGMDFLSMMENSGSGNEKTDTLHKTQMLSLPK